MLRVSHIYSKQNINSYAKAINIGLSAAQDVAPKALQDGGVKISYIKKVVQKYLPKIDVLPHSSTPSATGFKEEIGSFDMNFTMQKNGKYKVGYKMHVPELTELKDNNKIIEFFSTLGHETTHGALEDSTKMMENFLNKNSKIYGKDFFSILTELWIKFEDNSREKLFNPSFKKLKQYELKDSSDKALFEFLKLKNFDAFNTNVKEIFFETAHPAKFQPEDLNVSWKMLKAQSINEMVAYETTERIVSTFVGVPKSVYSYCSKFYENIAKAFHI